MAAPEERSNEIATCWRTKSALARVERPYRSENPVDVVRGWHTSCRQHW
jgi:hypothetical protein